MTKVFGILIFLNLLISCKSQTEREILLETSTKIVESIRQENVEKFISLIAFKDLGDISKNKELVTADIKRYNGLFKLYIGKKQPQIEIIDLYNFLGQKCIKIPIYNNKKDSSITEIHLDLLFGPASLFALDKITGYRLIENNSDSSDFHPYSYWKERGIAK